MEASRDMTINKSIVEVSKKLLERVRLRTITEVTEVFGQVVVVMVEDFVQLLFSEIGSGTGVEEVGLKGMKFNECQYGWSV